MGVRLSAARLILATLAGFLSSFAVAQTCNPQDDQYPALWKENEAKGCPVTPPQGGLVSEVQACMRAGGWPWDATTNWRNLRCTASDANGCTQLKEDATRFGSTVTYTYNRQSLTYPSGYQACPPPEPECGTPGKGWYRDVRAADVAAVQAEIGACYDGCQVESVEQITPGINKDPDGSFNFGVWIKSAGDSCSGGGGDTEPPETPADKPDGEICVTSSSGVEYCQAESYGENCGYVNDKFTCLGKTDPDECWVNDDGSRLCGESAPSPPVPDNGTPGVPATPTDTVKAAEGVKIDQVFNYYNSTVVAGSSRPAGDTGNNPNRPASSDPRTGVGGDGSDEEGEGGTASGGDDCSAPPTCEGDAIACAALNQAWRARCPQVQTEAQMREGITDTGVGSEGVFPEGSTIALTTDDFDSGGWLGGRSCPSPITADLGEFGGTVSYDPAGACGVLAILAQLILASAWITGARIAFGS